MNKKELKKHIWISQNIHDRVQIAAAKNMRTIRAQIEFILDASLPRDEKIIAEIDRLTTKEPILPSF